MVTPEHEQGIRLVLPDPIAHEIGLFLVDRQARGLSPGTISFYRKKLTLWRHLLASMSVTEVESITPHHLRHCLLELAKTHNRGGVHAVFRAFRTFLRWWETETEPEGWSNPLRKVQAPKVPNEPLEPLSVADLKAMVATCDKSFYGQRDKATLLALYDSGCRASEFLALNINDVNLSTGAVLVRHGKGAKCRTTFLGAKVRREVVRYLRHRPDARSGESLWVSAEWKRLTYWGLRQIVRRRAERAGLPEPGLHSFRRAFALACLRSGVDLISLQRLMGHSDLSVLRRYLAQTEDDLQAAHAKGGPVDNLL